MAERLQRYIDRLPGYRDKIEGLRDTLLANLIMLGEIPAPTFGEKQRVDLLQQRFSENGILDVSSDQQGNAVGILPGSEKDQNILLVAHVDTIFGEEDDHTITVEPDQVVGPGVGDNSLGLAVLATLPGLIEALEIEFRSNLILMGAAGSLGRGDLRGIKFFLKNQQAPIRAAVCVEGVQLGRLSIASIGMLRGEITCRVPDTYDWTRFGATGAILVANEVINRLAEISLPRRPRTTIVLGSIQGGTSFTTMASTTRLGFEIRSESAAMVKQIREQVDEIVTEVSSATGAEVTLDIFARRTPGGLPVSHPLPRCARRIMKKLGVETRLEPSTSELSALIDQHIPSLTVGITSGEHINQYNETIQIQPISVGLTQLLGLLLAIDRGYCDDG